MNKLYDFIIKTTEYDKLTAQEKADLLTEVERYNKLEKDLLYLKEQNIELFQFTNGRKIIGIDITNMPSEIEKIQRIIKETLKGVLGNEKKD